MNSKEEQYVLYKKDNQNYAMINLNTKKIQFSLNSADATPLSMNDADAFCKRCSKKLKGFKLLSVSNLPTKPTTVTNITTTPKTERRPFTAEERRLVYNKYQGKCNICGDFVPVDEFTVDHIVPISKGGTYDLWNLQCACKTCNRIKQDILPKDLYPKLLQIIEFQLGGKRKKQLRKIQKTILKKQNKHQKSIVSSSL
jgi:5-methylcytosine-specific restriction endonuclease McrA